MKEQILIKARGIILNQDIKKLEESNSLALDDNIEALENVINDIYHEKQSLMYHIKNSKDSLTNIEGSIIQANNILYEFKVKAAIAKYKDDIEKLNEDIEELGKYLF